MITIKNPYPGYSNGKHRSFDHTQSSYFYGREELLSFVHTRLRSTKCVSLVSRPHAGKTSFLQAGIRAHLNESKVYAQKGASWKVAYTAFRGNPLQSLAQSLAAPGLLTQGKISPDFSKRIYSGLKESRYFLGNLIQDSPNCRNNNLLLLLDNFGHAISSEYSAEDRERFVESLFHLTKMKNLAVYMVLASDALDLEINPPEYLLPWINYIKPHKVNLPSLNEAELVDAINKPAHIEGAAIDDSVIQFLLDLLLEDEDQLRKLQLYMHRAWFEYLKTRKKGRPLNLENLKRANNLNQTKLASRKSKSSSRSKQEIILNDSVEEIHETNELPVQLKTKLHRLLGVVSALKFVCPDRPITLEKLLTTLDINKSEFQKMRSSYGAVLTIDNGQVVIIQDSDISEFDEAINREVESAKAMIYLGEVALDHYVKGTALEEIISDLDLTKLSALDPMLLESADYALLYSDQGDLSLDIWRKLELSQRLAKNPSSKTKKDNKISMNLKESNKVTELATENLNLNDSKKKTGKIIIKQKNTP